MNELTDHGDPRDIALNYAYKLISFQARTMRHVSKKLKEKNFSDEIINDIIKTLIKQDLLNDRRYAVQWIEEKTRTRPIGKILAEKKLKEKGIESAIIKEVLEKKLPPSKEIEIAKSLIAKKTEKADYRGKDKRKILQKLSFFLSSRGFNYEIITEILQKIKITS